MAAPVLKKKFVFAALLTGALACSRATPQAIPTPGVTLLQTPRPAGTPSVFPRSAPAVKGYVTPDIAVSASITPNHSLRPHSAVSVVLTLRNKGVARTDIGAYLIMPGETLWRFDSLPPRSKTSDRCIDDALGHRCGAGTVDVGLGVLKRGETRTLRFKITLVAFKCPGAGDFIHENFIGLVGPVRRGPASFRILSWFANDPADLVTDTTKTGSPPAIDPTCHQAPARDR